MSLREQYNDLQSPGSYAGAYNFFRNRKLGKRLNDVRKELQTYDEYALFKPISRKFPRRQTVVPWAGHTLVSDLIQLTSYKRYNTNYQYVLVIIDGFSSKFNILQYAFHKVE